MDYFFPISSKGFVSTDRTIQPLLHHWLEQEIAQWVHHERSIQWPIAPWANALTTELHLTPCCQNTSYISLLAVRTLLPWSYISFHAVRNSHAHTPSSSIKSVEHCGLQNICSLISRFQVWLQHLTTDNVYAACPFLATFSYQFNYD